MKKFPSFRITLELDVPHFVDTVSEIKLLYIVIKGQPGQDRFTVRYSCTEGQETGIRNDSAAEGNEFVSFCSCKLLTNIFLGCFP